MKQSLLHLFLVLGSFTTFGQSLDKIKVKETYKEQLLILVLGDLEVKYRLKFQYDAEQIRPIRVSAHIYHLPLKDALRLILQDTGLGYEFKDNRTIAIITKKDEKLTVETTKEIPTQFNFKITGQIKDAATGESLPFAQLVLLNTTNGTTTNTDGYFTLFNVPSDTAVIVAQYLGYRTNLIRLSPKMEMDNLTIILEENSQDLNEILIIGQQEDQLIKASTGISQIGLTPAQIATLPSFGEKDIFRSLQLLPGISGSNESSSGLYVRGGTPDQNLVLFDGFTVYHVDHLFGFFSAFNSNAIKDVQLYKGGFEPKFGGRISSVVELTGKDGNRENFNIGAGISLVSTNLYAEGPFANGKGSFLVAGRRSFQSNFYNNLFEAFTETNTSNQPPDGRGGGRFAQLEAEPNSYFYDLNAKLTYRTTNKDVLSLSFYNGQDDLNNSRIIDESNLPARFQNLGINFNSDVIDLTEWGNWGGSFKWAHKWSDRFYSNINASFSNYFSLRDRRQDVTIERQSDTIQRFTGTLEDNNLNDYTFKWDNEFKISPTNQLEFGWQTTYNDITYDFTRNDTLNVLNRDEQGFLNTLYIQDRWTLADKFIIKGGIRATHYNVTNDFYLEPRASVIFQATDKIKLKGAWGLYNQFATRVIRQDILQGSRDFWVLGNDIDVPINQAEHFIGGISYETPTWLVDIEVYHKNLRGIAEYTAQTTLQGFGPNATIQYEENFYQGDGIAEGVEFLLQRKTGKLTGWLAYTIGRVNYDFPDLSEQTFPANHDQRHELKLVGSYNLGRWTFAGTFVYATGRPYTAPTGVYELTLLDGSTETYFEVSDKNALRLPDYHRLDLSATYNFKLFKGESSLGLSLYNLYDRQNVWYKEFEVIEGDLIETNISLLNFTPSLFFTWNLR